MFRPYFQHIKSSSFQMDSFAHCFHYVSLHDFTFGFCISAYVSRFMNVPPEILKSRNLTCKPTAQKLLAKINAARDSMGATNYDPSEDPIADIDMEYKSLLSVCASLSISLHDKFKRYIASTHEHAYIYTLLLVIFPQTCEPLIGFVQNYLRTCTGNIKNMRDKLQRRSGASL